MKRTIWWLGGITALGLGCFFAAALILYFQQGAGLQFFWDSPSAGSVLLGVVHVTGLCVLSGTCFLIGIGWCSHGLVSDKQEQEKR
jgi:hypothetical protein